MTWCHIHMPHLTAEPTLCGDSICRWHLYPTYKPGQCGSERRDAPGIVGNHWQLDPTPYCHQRGIKSYQRASISITSSDTTRISMELEVWEESDHRISINSGIHSSWWQILNWTPVSGFSEGRSWYQHLPIRWLS
jgi:hypothetical protein